MKNKGYIVILLVLLSITISNVSMANPTAIGLNFVDEDIRVVLHTIATLNDLDMIIDDSIKGKITMTLNNITVDEAINLITSAKGLSYRKIGNTFIIEPSEIGTTEVIKLNYTRAIDIKKTLEPIATSLKLKMEIDDVQNSLVVFGSPAGCARIKTIITDLDVLQQQISLEAKVVAVNRSNMKDLGVDWTWEPVFKYPERRTEDTTTKGVTKTKVTTTREKNVGTIQFGHSPIAEQPYEFYYQAKISALVSHGNAKILASPKVTTINGKEAHILVGDRIPVITETIADSKTTNSVSYVDAGIKLTYTPSITADGTITTKVRTEISTPTLVADIKNYRITTREAESIVCMKDGETMVIGGLIGFEESKNESKIPFLSDIPILGTLFKSIHNSKSETEVIIFLTAKITKFQQ